MVFKKLLKGLPVLGVLSMLLACPGPDAAQADGTEAPSKDPVVNANKTKIADLDKKLSDMMSKKEILDEIEKLRKEGKLIIDPKDPKAVWSKVVQIMRKGQTNCNFFYPKTVIESKGIAEAYPGPISGTLTIFAAKTKGAIATPDGLVAKKTAAKEIIVWEYKNYSVDGIYQLDGKISLTATGAIDVPTQAKPFLFGAAATDGLLVGKATDTATIGAGDGNTLKLSAVKGKHTEAGFAKAEDKATITFGEDFGVSFVMAGTKCPDLFKKADKQIEVKAVGETAKAEKADLTIAKDLFGAVGTAARAEAAITT